MTETSPGVMAALPAVLVVEPDATIAQLFAQALSEEGYAAEWVTSPHDALAVLMARGPAAFAVVLSAPCAPARAPYTWLSRLRAWTPAPIVICARHAATRYADHRARGVAAIIEQPCHLQDVLDVVTQLCPTPPSGQGVTREPRSERS